MKEHLDITLIQSPLLWEDVNGNLALFEDLIHRYVQKPTLIILPEMFTTGFSMNPSQHAEEMNGVSMEWLKAMAAKCKSIITGSLAIKENNAYYNRLVWMQPDGHFGYYDKRHLFSYAGEDKQFTRGEKRFIAQVNGWKICAMICYDLRFPVWSRHQKEQEFDVLIYVANWPQRRSAAWNTLLKARAIENQCYVIGVNRTGVDGMNMEYLGDSQVISPMGEVLFHTQDETCVHSFSLSKKEIESVRTQFPFLNDRDDFVIL